MDVFTLVKDSDVAPVLLDSQPTVATGSQRHTVGSARRTVWASHAESECGKRVRDDRQVKKNKNKTTTAGWGVAGGEWIGGRERGAQARSEWLARQRVPLVLDRAVQTGGVHVVVVGSE